MRHCRSPRKPCGTDPSCTSRTSPVRGSRIAWRPHHPFDPLHGRFDVDLEVDAVVGVDVRADERRQHAQVIREKPGCPAGIAGDRQDQRASTPHAFAGCSSRRPYMRARAVWAEKVSPMPESIAFAAVSRQRPAQARGPRRSLSFSSSQSESMRRIISGLVSCSGFSARSLSNASIMGLGRRTITASVSFGGLPTDIFPL